MLCVKRKVKCNGAMPTCGECNKESLSCRYDSSTLADRIRDPLHLRDIEGRLKKVETQLARSAGNTSSRKQQMDKRPQQQPQGTAVRTSRAPDFRIENGGLCIETDISEAHHFLKALFRSVDSSQVEKRTREVFGPSLSLNKSDHIREMYDTNEHLLDYLMADDPIGDSWVNMVISSRHNRCFIMYQMVGQKPISCATTDLRRLASKNCKQDLLLAMSLRAFVYQHENDFHQDAEYPIQTSKGYQYMECAKNILEECYTTSSRTTIRALLYLFNFHMYQHPEEAFRYGDLAVRMAQDLDLHKGKYTNEDDRRLWWAAYWCNLYAAVHFERPLLILNDDIQVEFPKKLPDESLDVGYCIDFCIMSIKLLQIQKLMMDRFQTSNDPSMIFQRGKELEDHLNHWHSILPSHARVDEDCSGKDRSNIELGIILNTKFQHAKIQLYQCFLDSAGPLGLIAIHNCINTFHNLTEMLVRNDEMLNMCTWKVIIPDLHHILVTWRKITKTTNIEDSLLKLREVLKHHVFMYLKEAQSIIDLIEDTLPSSQQRLENSSTTTMAERKSPASERDMHDFDPTNTHQQAGKQPVAIPSDDPYLMQFPISIPGFPLGDLAQAKWNVSDGLSKSSPTKVDNTASSNNDQPESRYELTTAFNHNDAVNVIQTRGDTESNSLHKKWPLNTDYRWVSDDGLLCTNLLDGVTPATDLAGLAISDTTAHQNVTGFSPAPVNSGQPLQTMINQSSPSTLNTSTTANQYYDLPAIPPLEHPTAASSSSLVNNTVQSSSTFLEAPAGSAPSFHNLGVSDWQLAWNMFPNQVQDHSQWTKRSEGNK